MNEEYPIDRAGSSWDGWWHGRGSSVRRSLANVGLEAARCAALIREAAREADAIRGSRRSAALHAIRDEILGLTDDMRAVCDFLLAEAGERPPEPLRRSLLARFMRWFRG